jgi:hypothetical protein
MARPVDPTTQREIWSGPQGEGGGTVAQMQAYAKANGIDPSRVVVGDYGAYIPGVGIQAGNRAALGLDYQPGLTSAAPGASQTVLGLLQSTYDTQQELAQIQAKEQARVTRNFDAEASLLFPWIPTQLRGVFIDAWARYGDANLAMGALRQDQRYEQFFPGNRRPDGTTVLPEAEYLSTTEGYDRRFRMFQLDPADFRSRYAELIQGGSSPDELEADLAEVQQEVILQAPAVRAEYAAYGYSADISDRAIMASRLTPGVSAHVFEQRYRAAQIGAEATSLGFTYNRGSAERYAQAGVTQDQARQLFGKAASELPTLQELMRRHNDPEDDLTLDEYTDAFILRDPEHLQAIARVLTGEKSLFSSQNLLATDQAGRAVGLLQR